MTKTAFDTIIPNTSQAEIRYSQETDWGVIPSIRSAFDPRRLRFTSESLNTTPVTVSSNEITGRRSVANLILTNRSAGGNISAEFSPDTYDEFISAATFSPWVNLGTAGSNTLAAVSATLQNTSGRGSIHPSSATTGFTQAGINALVVGQAIRLGTLTSTVADSDNNLGVYTIVEIRRLTSRTSDLGNVVAIDLDREFPVPISVASPVTLVSSYTSNSAPAGGIERKSFTFEKYFPFPAKDSSEQNRYVLHQGMLVNSFSLNLTTASIVDISMDFLGKTATAYEQGTTGYPSAGKNTLFPKTVLGAPSTEPINTTSNVGEVIQSNEVQSLISSMNIDISNNLTSQDAIGTLGAVGVGVGQSNVTGSLTTYFTNFRMYNSFINNTDVSLRFTLVGDDENGVETTYVFYLPRIKLTGGSHAITGPNADITITTPYEALSDAFTGASIIISKV